MRKPLVLVSILAVTFGMSIDVAAQSVVSRDQNKECLCIASEVVQPYCMRENANVTKSDTRIAQESIARRDIQKLINSSVEADEAKDEAASNHIFTADFTIKDLDGKLWTSADMQGKKGASGQHYDQILKVSNSTRIAIECLTLKENEAVVYTNQHLVRYVPDRKDGSPHEVITNIIHREVWIFTENGWRCKHIEELQRGGTFLDGQPFDA